jgi:protein-disulfide isomerase
MNYFLSLCKFPILSLVLASLFLGSLPARAETESLALPRLDRSNSSLPNALETRIAKERVPVDKVSVDGAVKVSPQLEKQIIEVLRRHPDVLLDVLQKYAIEQQQKELKAQAEAIKQIRKNTKVLIGDSPVTGATDRQIVMVAFSDFQCQFCATADKSIKQFMEKHKDKVTLVYKHFPLTQIHPEALPAAGAAWAANKQGKFWEYHDALFANQAKLGEIFYLETANSLKLDLKKFNADRKIADNAIVQDFQLGRRIGVDGTPTFIMNGEVLTGAASLADLEKAFEKITKK